METRCTRSYWVTRPRKGELRIKQDVHGRGDDMSWVRTEYSGISVGTERLVGLGEVPPECTKHMPCRYMEGDLALPVKYGYCLVGTAIEGALAGERLFVMHPHQDHALIENAHATVLPASVPARRAVLIPNMETALNAVWDAELGPDENAVVVGAGAVGILVAYVLWRNFGRPVPLADIDPARSKLASGLPWLRQSTAPEDLETGGAQVAFHASGYGTGLQSALNAVGFEGRVIELSWYGIREVHLALGADFHYRRKRIQASQVAAIAPARRATHDYAARLRVALELLDHPDLDRLLGEPVPFDDMPTLMAEMYAGATTSPLPVIGYQQG